MTVSASQGRRQRTGSHQRAAKAAANLVLLGVALAFALPLVWLLESPFNSTATMSLTVPGAPSLDNFRAVLTPEITWRPMVNGLLLSATSAVVVVACSVLAAYPLSRYKLRYGTAFLYVMVFGSSLPLTAIMVPVYQMFVQTNLVDSYLGVVLFLSSSALPYGIWMTKNFMDAVPIELEESAWTEGAGRLKALRHIVVPLMVPGIAVIFIFNFIEFWGNFFVPYILLLDPLKQPMSVTLYSFFGQHGQIVYGQLAAFALVYTAPILVLFLLVQRYLQQGFRMSGAVKA